MIGKTIKSINSGKKKRKGIEKGAKKPAEAGYANRL